MQREEEVPVPGRDGELFPNIKYFRCHQYDHRITQCPICPEQESHAQMEEDCYSVDSGEESAAGFFQFDKVKEYVMNQGCKERIEGGLILLDSASSCNIFKDAYLLEDIKGTDRDLELTTNAGKVCANRMGKYSRHLVWYNSSCIANILSLAKLAETCRIVMDTLIDNAIYVEWEENEWQRFKHVSVGLYVYLPSCNTNNSIEPYSFVQTVANNIVNFSNAEVNRAILSHRISRRVGSPPLEVFINWLDNGYIRECPVTLTDAKNAEKICGKYIVQIRGKLKKPKQNKNPEIKKYELPIIIKQKCKNIRLFADVMHINKNPFLHTISKKVKLRTSTYLISEKKESLLDSINKVRRIYRTYGFEITYLESDKQFECLQDHIIGVKVDIAAPQDHVNEVEHSIRTVKESIRCIVHDLTFRQVTRLVVCRMMEVAIRNLNQFPHIRMNK